ncbi:MAG: hypothetical protein JW973_12395 [Bacteroidales bacterium]|nr:hypothetical protein [Bacteroidales bacterium]
MSFQDMRRTIIWLTVFSIAMAYLESAVVVYLRVIIYPEGFDFPLAPLRHDLAVTEIFREAATIIMLLGAGYLGGRNFATRFAGFVYCFAVWDIFYYVFLKVLVGWPDSLMTWDVLFLIPVTWTGPVISPIIVSCTMILLAVIIITSNRKRGDITVSCFEWVLLIAGSFILVVSFVWDYCSFLLRHYSFIGIIHPSDRNALFELALQYVPVRFPWMLFTAGEAVILMAICLLFRRHSKKNA